MDETKRLASALDPNRAELRAYQPTLRDRIASFFVGDERASPEKARLVEGIFGSRGLGNTGMGLVDLTPAGAPLWKQELDEAGSAGDAVMAAANFLPGAKGVAQGVKAAAPEAGSAVKSFFSSPIPGVDWTNTGAAFKDVATPHKLMEKGDWRRFNTAMKEGEFLEAELPIRSMFASQQHVNPDFATYAGNGELPVVMKKGGNYYVQDGHHRLVRQAAEGSQTAKVRLVDLDDSTQTEFPLVDLMR
jgi:hypothetical protein